MNDIKKCAENSGWILCRVLCVWLCWALSGQVMALGETPYIVETSSTGSMPLVTPAANARLYVDIGDYPGVQRVAGHLQADVARVTGQSLDLVHQPHELGDHAVIIGTLGQSSLIEDLVNRERIDVSGIRDQWDAYLIQLVENPLPNVKRALVIVGANKRGTSYGVYDVSEQVGVSPWYYWADVPPAQKKSLYVLGGTRKQDAPKVQYRGIFLNDEAPALTNWVQANHGNYNHEFYAKVFELLLRLKGNFMWPAMWNNAFNDDDPRNQALADEYGVVMSTSHHEPMMRADKEWNRYGKGNWEYSTNPKNIYEFWRQGAIRAKPYESVFTMGMRGQEDKPMSEGENIGLLEKIVADQRTILAEVFNDRPISEVPQVWCLYKEVQSYYEKGMRVPDDVILLWSDDNWGNIRRLPTPEERKRSGGAGVYYHFDYVGGPRSYRWINTVPIAKIWEQMNLADKYGAHRIWITNVGDLKPMEYPTEFFLRMAWNPDAWPKERLQEFGRLWAEREFGKEYANDVETLMTAYSRHNGRRKPELMSPDTYSVLHYGESERILAELQQMTDLAESTFQKIPAERKDAFYQLVLHPVLATANITRLNIAIGKNRLYAAQGRANTDVYRQQAKDFFAYDAALKERYHSINNGKWRHFMDQSHIGYTNWQNPEGDQLPALAEYIPGNYAEMGIAVEGISDAWPAAVSGHWPHSGKYEMPFDFNGQKTRELVMFNRGTVPYEFSAEVPDWILLSQSKGKVEDELRIQVSINWKKVPEANSAGTIAIRGTGWQGAKITVTATKPETKLQRRARGFLEADGYISMEAASFTKKNKVDGYEWQEVPNHGHTRSSITPFPVDDRSFADPLKAPFVEYPVTFFSKGTIDIHTLLAPSWPFVPGRGLRYAIAIGDEQPQIVDFLKGSVDTDASWETAVETGVRIGRSQHNIEKAGPTVLRIYMVDPGVAVQKILVDTGGLLPSYLGPPQSPFK